MSEGPKFTIYYTGKKKNKLAGFLDGNTVFYKNHKSIAGTFNESDINTADMLFRGRVVERIKDGETWYVEKEDKPEKLSDLKDLQLTSFRKPYPNAKLEIDEINNTAKIFKETPKGDEVIGIVEGDLKQMNDVRFYAIIIFLFEWFC